MKEHKEWKDKKTKEQIKEKRVLCPTVFKKRF